MFVRVKHSHGGEAEVSAESLPLWRSRGWEPLSEPRSKHQADLERAAREDAAAEAVKAEAPQPRRAFAPRSVKPAAESAATNEE